MARKYTDEQVRKLYDRSVKIPFFWYLDAWFGRATADSIYRKRAISLLGLTRDSHILDVACGTGLNFKILESYLQDHGKITGVDLSPGVLEEAKRVLSQHNWTNIELVNMSITDFHPGVHFDAALCTLALTIIPDYEAAIDRIHDLLKPGGRFAVLGMKTRSKMPKSLYALLEKAYRLAKIDLDRDVLGRIEATFKRIDSYEECFGGFYYILEATKQ